MTQKNRRTFIKQGLLGYTLGMLSNLSHAARPTPNETEGPFYPVIPQKDKDFDLTKIAGNQGIAQGQIINIQGQVIDSNNKPIENATIDLWQANSAGRYRHPHDTSTAPLDPHFQGWAIIQSGQNGTFRFKTVIPGAYPVSSTWTRPPHIHFKLSKNGYIELTTQMYFPNHPLNRSDSLLNQKNPAERVLMIATKIDTQVDTYQYMIVLQRV